MPCEKDLIRIAALRNCEGASHLGDGEFDEAIAKFAVAYYCINRAVDGGTRNANHDNDSATADEAENGDDDDVEECLSCEDVDKYHFVLDSPFAAWFSASNIQEHSQQVAALSRTDITASAYHFVYSEALVFNPANANDPRETPFFKGIIIFNVALTFHRRGLQDGTSSVSLQKALHFYNRCLDSIRKGEPHTNQVNIMIEAHMLIATLNNKTQLLFGQGEYIQASYCLAELQKIMDGTAGKPPGFDEHEVRGLESTIDLLNSPEVAAAIN